MASKKWYSKVEDTCEAIGWYVASPVQGCYDWEFSKESPAGEDFIVNVFAKNLPELKIMLQDYYETFDREDHVLGLLEAKRNGFRGVPDLDTLVQDSHDIEDMLKQLAMEVDKIK